MSRNREKGQSRPAGRILRQSALQTATLAPARSSVSSEKYIIRCGKQKAETEAPHPADCKDRSDGARTQRCGEELVGIKVVERRLKPVAEGVRPEEQAQEHGRGLSTPASDAAMTTAVTTSTFAGLIVRFRSVIGRMPIMKSV